ncbi:hypothetical protein PVK06_025196 [Gossypium arboreum]|uniref:Uncharacterized protein n=1 Tax=Gossypium arboreum TaxID=29729 RepID=A0ABR0PG51_GOSAR|nr:hypothetical protein PVK06_025196 [Gossypium arboreum]
MLEKSRKLVHVRWNYEPNYVGLLEELEYIKLLLDQHSEAEVRTMQQSTTEKDDDAANPKETIAQGVMLDTYSGDDDNDEELYRLAPTVVRLVVCRNPSYNCRPPPCGTHSP